jgi:hypothetical protein
MSGAAGGLAQNTIPLFAPGKIRAIIFSGRNNHDWRSSTPYLQKLLLDSGRFDVRVVEEPAGTTAETLAVYDVLLLDYNGPRWGAATEQAVEEFVRSGKGMVVVHGASWAFNGLPVLGDRHAATEILEPAWPAYGDMIGGVWSLEEPRTGHGELHSFKVQFIDPNHPVARGMEETFLATDELYHHMRMRPGAKVIAAAYDDPKMRGTGKDEPVLWTVDYGKGRVFHTTLGHDLAAMIEPGFILTFLRGAEWAATGRVTLPAKLHPAQARLEKIKTRALVVTGGHAYDTSFYTLFEGYDDLHWDHALSNHEAYREDIRPNYDVLVLYDFVQDITEAEKKNLAAFVESGKGLVVLHHAIADYQHWSWWYETVVGGRYVLKPEGGHPGSKYKHDEEMFVEPVAKHPVTAGISRMRIWDETYKDVWISPKAQVLLRTNNPTSDGPVAWISPYEKGRVVYIQLGHDRMAHVHPGYRVLVRNAILWARGGKP